ncbi:MAG: hypothetical protein KDA60_01130 [Planctomycetales bacterium]|nr:hypothetical protein [Planctomycetales bacterium]
MIESLNEYEHAKRELRSLEERLQRLQKEHPNGTKGYTKAGVRKMIARLHEELAVFEASAPATESET